MKIRFKKLDERATLPSYAHEGDSGMDVRALEDGVVFHNSRLAVPTGIAAQIPEGYELQVRPRSGLQFNNGVICAFGTVDRGYTGEIRVLLVNTTSVPFAFRAGDRVAQLVLAPVVHADVEEVPQGVQLDETERGSDGFGSTGMN